MSIVQLSPVPLNVENFADYGDVVEHRGSEVRRILETPFLKPSFDLCHRFSVNRLARPSTEKIEITQLERHPYSAQTFIPLSASRHLVVVALSDPDGRLDPSTLRAYMTNGRQGVSYRPSVWHFAFTAVDADSEVAVILGLTGRDDDTEYTALPYSTEVLLF